MGGAESAANEAIERGVDGGRRIIAAVEDTAEA